MFVVVVVVVVVTREELKLQQVQTSNIFCFSVRYHKAINIRLTAVQRYTFVFLAD